MAIHCLCLDLDVAGGGAAETARHRNDNYLVYRIDPQKDQLRLLWKDPKATASDHSAASVTPWKSKDGASSSP